MANNSNNFHSLFYKIFKKRKKIGFDYMKKIISVLLLLVLNSQNAFSEIIIFNCSDIFGNPHHTFKIDMKKKIIDDAFEFEKGSTNKIVYTANYSLMDDNTYMGQLHELRLMEEISYMHMRDPLQKSEIIAAKADINILFKAEEIANEVMTYELKCKR